MLTRRLFALSRVSSARFIKPKCQSALPCQFARYYADKVVKVPQMAESISEGTLKQFTKSIGDFVEQDEEIATIETDKVRS